MSCKILKYSILIVFILLNLNNSLSFVLKINPLLIGTWKLRTTNDKNIDRFSYLILNGDNTFKFKSIKYNGIIAIKTSRSGIINNINKNPLLYPFNKNAEININYKSINKYSYSLFGIEIPELKMQSNSNYKLNKNLIIYIKDRQLFIQTKNQKYYYIFDVCDKINKLPYIEITFTNLMITQIISFTFNILSVKLLDLH
jgi:hypothetical protein